MIFEVYTNPKFLQTLKIKDVSSLYFLRSGFLYQYLLFGFNVIYAFYRGFVGFGIMLLATEVMLASVFANLPTFYAVMLDASFGLFVGAFAGDIEKWFLQKRGNRKITQIIASSKSQAKQQFFIEYLPTFIEQQINKTNHIGRFAKDARRVGISARNIIPLSQKVKQEFDEPIAMKKKSGVGLSQKIHDTKADD